MNQQRPSSDHRILDQYILWRLLKQTQRLLRWLTIMTICITVLFGVTLLYLRSKPLPPPDLYSPTLIYDNNGKLLSQMEVGEKREPVKLSNIPPSLIRATLAAEDRTFYDHWGFSLRGILRATWANLRAGHVVQGASTITQQLARNLYLTHDRTWTRKVKEAVLTAQLELHFTKQEILEMYLNEIYYGHGAYGVGRAARMYFNKDVRDLTLAESAFLAGIPRGPQYYSPYFHINRTREREDHILQLMVQDRMITPRAANTAEQEIVTVLKPNNPKQVVASYFRDYLVQTAVTKYGLEEPLVRHGGLKIYTTLDPKLQKQAEQSVRQVLADHQNLQGALISVDPHTGEIRAMVGGTDYQQSQFNRVFAKRQPGSSFKPVLYLTALENGFTPLTQIMSQPTSFVYEGNVYRPANFKNQYPNRLITMREAVAHSDNIYAVTTQLRIGMENVIEMAKRLGIKSTLHETPSLALGSYAVTPFEMAQVYSTLAAGGVSRPLTGIKKIVDLNGTVLVENNPIPVRVTSEAHAFVLTQLLSSVLDIDGTAHRVRQMFTRPAAAKTGTTNWDGWISGYTPDLATTVWVGYDQGHTLSHNDARLSQYIWGKYMEKATRHLPIHPFAIPAGVKAVYIDSDTGYLATPSCKHTQLEYFVSGTEPKESCPMHPALHPKGWLDQLINWWNNL